MPLRHGSQAGPAADREAVWAGLGRQLGQARSRTDDFFALLTPTALLRRSIAERHRLIFYLGHLDAFDWNLLGRRLLGRPSLDSGLEQLFAFGIDPIAGSLPSDTPSDWPTAEKVWDFCQRSRQAIDVALAEVAAGASDGLGDGSAVAMAIEHRLMHLETLAYQLPHLPLDSFVDARPHRPDAQPGPSAAGERAAWGRQQATIAAGVATLGRQPEGDFCWDNESPQLKLWVPGFAIDRGSVTNRQFRDFVVAGGYSDRSLWSAADWAWKESRQLGQPLLWQQRPGGLWLRACFAELPLPLDWPALVSLAEARAYVAYRQHKDSQPSLRLMSEAEYHRAAYGRPADADDPAGEPDSAALPWGDGPAQPLVHGNFGCVRYDPTAVAAFPAGDSAWGVSDLVGNGWEWTQTPFAPLPGFRADPRYPGYSQDFFDQQHFVLKGASARTDGRFLRQSFRNWFQPHYPYVFAKFRCVATPAE